MNPIIDSIGDKRWENKRGLLHRTDGPAIIDSDGTKCWYINGNLHRPDGPAIIDSDGRESWYINGEETEPIPDYILLCEKKLK